MTPTGNQFIEIRKNRRGLDRPFVVGTRTRVQDIVVLHERFAQSADDIAGRHFPHLSLAQVHAALSYFYQDRQTIWQCIHDDERFAESLRGELTSEHPPIANDAPDASVPS